MAEGFYYAHKLLLPTNYYAAAFVRNRAENFSRCLKNFQHVMSTKISHMSFFAKDIPQNFRN